MSKTYLELLAEMSATDQRKAGGLTAQIIAHNTKMESAPVADRKRYFDHWAKETDGFRKQLRAHLDSVPSLHHHFPKILEKAHRDARSELKKYRTKDGKPHPFKHHTLTKEYVLSDELPKRPD